MLNKKDSLALIDIGSNSVRLCIYKGNMRSPDILYNKNDDIYSGFNLTLFFIKKFLDAFDFNNLKQLLFARIRLQNNFK